MMSLFLDTSNSKLIVGVVDEANGILKTYYNENLDGELSTKVFSVIQKCIDDAGITPDNIEKIYSVVGPGSFTGVRIGVTIAKTFAWAKKIEVIPLSSLEVLASTKVNTKYIVPMIDARRECVYAGVYDNNLNSIVKDSYISLDNLKREIPSDNECTFVSDDDIAYFDGAIASNVDIINIINKHRNDKGINPHNLKPEYLKITEAEANLLKKSND